MAPLITLVLVTVIIGACIGAFLKLSFAIRRDDKGQKWALRREPPTPSARVARGFVGISSSRWD